MTDRQHDGLDEELRTLARGDEGLVETASQVRGVLHEVAIDEEFRDRLGAEVLALRVRIIQERSRRWRWLPGRPLALLAAATVAAAAVLAAVLVPRVGGPATIPVSATSPAAGLASFDPGGRVEVSFSQPMDHDSVTAAVHLTPATAIDTSWAGEDLVVTPIHGLAPNSPYVLTIDRKLARTAAGTPLATDLHVLFGTAPAPEPGAVPPRVVPLPLRPLTPAAGGSEAVIVAGGVAVASSGNRPGASGVLRLGPGGAVARLAPASDAICVSRSGNSLAYLQRTNGATSIVMAAGDGSAPRTVTVPVDDGSPLGWIGDAEVTFVGGGRLRAVDPSGHVRVLSTRQVDAATDAVVISPGSRYVYLRHGIAQAAPGQGTLIDLTTGATHTLAGIVDQPAFSADGATVAWFDGSGRLPRLAVAPSAGGPVLELSLPAATGDRLTDLSLAPSGGRFVYSVRHADGRSELRLAAIDDGATVAVSTQGGGASPNWAPDGASVAVLAQSGGQPQIAVADVPGATASVADAAAALTAAFASAQIGHDPDALRALATDAVHTTNVPAASRASVVEIGRQPDGSFAAQLRLMVDPTPGHPSARALTENLELTAAGPGAPLLVADVYGDTLADVPPGPHLTRIATGAAPGTLALTFDADLDPASVVDAFTVSGGRPVVAAYDTSNRTVTLTSPKPLSGPLTVTIGPALADVAGQHPTASVSEDWPG